MRKHNELMHTVVRFTVDLMRCMDQVLEQRIIRAILKKQMCYRPPTAYLKRDKEPYVHYDTGCQRDPEAGCHNLSKTIEVVPNT